MKKPAVGWVVEWESGLCNSPSFYKSVNHCCFAQSQHFARFVPKVRSGAAKDGFKAIYPVLNCLYLLLISGCISGQIQCAFFAVNPAIFADLKHVLNCAATAGTFAIMAPCVAGFGDL
jgi:hypothetical protein